MANVGLELVIATHLECSALCRFQNISAFRVWPGEASSNARVSLASRLFALRTHLSARSEGKYCCRGEHQQSFAFHDDLLSKNTDLYVFGNAKWLQQVVGSSRF